MTEQVLIIPGFGDLRYNPKSKALVAHCNHCKHGDCRRQRTSVLGKSAALFGAAANGQGKPLGLLMAWLLEQNDFRTRREHVSNSLVPLRHNKRVEGRNYLKNIPGQARCLSLDSTDFEMVYICIANNKK